MSVPLFDPWREQHRLEWRNRAARWRQAPGETAFHALAWLALAAVLAWLAISLWQREAASHAVRAALLRWPWAAVAAAFAAMLAAQSQRLHQLREAVSRGWLHAQPVPDATFVRRRVRALAAGFAAQCLVAAALFVWLRMPMAAWLVLPAAGLAAAIAAAAFDPKRTAHAIGRAKPALRPRLADAGTGSLWRWQRTEAALALHGRGLAPGLFVLLLIPSGTGPFAIAASLATGLLLSAAATAWARMLAVFPQAQRWLGAQPLDHRGLLRGGLPLPLALLGGASAAAGALLSALGMPPPAAAAFAALLFACGTLHALAAVAERARPRRIAFAATLHLALLLSIVQSLPPAAPVFWLAQLGWLLRRSGEPLR